jgi:hypothetical protein
MHITKETLLAAGTEPDCPDLAAFCAAWPDGWEVTEETVSRAVALETYFCWIVRRLLCDPAREKYNRVKGPAVEEYNRAARAAWYKRRSATVRIQNQEYHQALVPAKEEYYRALGQAFLTACQSHDQRQAVGPEEK